MNNVELKKKLEEIHWLAHEASYSISFGDLGDAKQKILEIDMMTHDMIDKVNS